MQLTLQVIAGPHKDRSFRFDGHNTFIVGRSSQAHFRLAKKDRYFSRFHFMLEINPPCCRLIDMGSRNGTFVNGQQVSMADLKAGDRIEAGETVLCVLVEPTAALAGAPAGSMAASQAPHARKAAPAQEAAIDSDVALFANVALPLSPGPIKLPPRETQLPVSHVVAACVVCAAPLEQAGVSSRVSRAQPGVPPICPSCWEKSQRIHQPFARYQVFKELGRGAMGIVYLALGTQDNRLVALKTLIPAMAASKVQIDRFIRETSILSELDHPNIIKLREMGEANGQVFYAMEYMEGINAGRLLGELGPLPVERALGLICQLLDGLAYAHGKGFVHRDIKPANLLIAQANGRDLLKLADFGLARVYQSSQMSGLTVLGDLGGTMAFMAPEQITNFREVSPPADQYAAAATLYNLLTNRFIYNLPRSLPQQITVVLEEETVPIRSRRADIPQGLAAVIHRALVKDPKDRYPDAAAMRMALAAYC